MIRRTAYLLVLLTLGCGPADFTGNYQGTLSAVGTCTDGSNGSQTTTVTIIANQSNSAATFAGFQTLLVGCNSLQADVSGSTATFAEAQCPLIATATGSQRQSILAKSTASLDGSKLKVSLKAFGELRDSSGQQTGTCTSSVLGTLPRLE